MSGKNIIALIIAIIVGIFAIRVVFWLIGAVFSILGTLLFIGLAAGVVYVLYRVFNHMLTTGKRLT
jgi:hypothetical protein